MTTELDFRRALAENPDDADARMVFADWLDEQDRPREACVNRIVARPDEDRHRFDFATWLERAKEFTHATYVRSTLVRPGNVNVQPASFHESAFRRVACSACEGRGKAPAPDPASGRTSGEWYTDCFDCNGTGDVGGLCERYDHLRGTPDGAGGYWRYLVLWRRGCPERVECRLADVVEQYDRIVPGAAPIMPDFAYRVTDWARRVCRWHPVLELWVTGDDCRPGEAAANHRSHSLFPFCWERGWRSGNWWHLPEIVFDALGDCEFVSYRGGTPQRCYGTELAARTALARGLARIARA